MGAPTQVHWLSTTVLSALEQAVKRPEKCDLYHLSPEGETSLHGFALALVQEGCRLGLLAQPIPVNPVSSANWSQATRRPINSRLDCRRFSTVFGIQIPAWEALMGRWLASQCEGG